MSDRDLIREIFLRAVEIESPENRAAYVNRACADDEVVRNRVKSLLGAHELPDSLLDRAAVAANINPSDTVATPIGECLEQQIGPYKLLEQIGEGGFGIVYLAEQQEPVRRQVALKIIKPGMDTREVIARFEAERQALALMDHPGIARVLDAGATLSGRPYFVMELVRGIPITDYCDGCHLSTRERLGLFGEVCQAVQHAHQKGIIHRDIKPTNVLVAMQDGQPMVKVIDFGVAKAIGQRLTERTLMTGLTQLVGTPLYMSPEQAEMGALDIDTRSDIYALGVLLYELLTGTTPFEKERLQHASYDDLRRIIREEEPPKPSTRISTLEQAALSTVSEHRRCDSRKLLQVVRGDLDWIVMKALDKDRGRRYESASAFASDVARYMDQQPVEARPPSATYRFRKFAARNRTRLVAATLALLIVVGGWGAATVLIARERNAAQLAASEAEKERKRAEENLLKAKEAVDTWFTEVAADMEGKPHMTDVQRSLLEQALEFYQGFLKQKADDPEIRREAAFAYRRVANIYGMLGRKLESADASEKSVAILQGLAAENPDDVDLQDTLAHGYRGLGIGRFFASEIEAAAATTPKAIEIWEKLARGHPTVPAYPRMIATTHVDLANQLARLPGRLPEAEAHCRESLARWEQFRKQFPELTMQTFEEAHSHHWLASVLIKAGKYEEVEDHLRRSIELRSKLVAEQPQAPDRIALLAHARLYLGQELVRKGSFDEAISVLKTTLDELGPLVDDYPDVADFRGHLRMAYFAYWQALFSQGRYEEAERAARDSAALLTPQVDEINVGWNEYNRGLIVHRLGHTQLAADLFRSALARFEQAAEKYPQDSPQHCRAQNALQWVFVSCPLPQFHDPERALRFAKHLAQIDPTNAGHWTDIGLAHYRLGHFDEAVDAFQRNIQMSGNVDSSTGYFLAMALWKRGDKDEARERFQKAVESKENRDGWNSPEQRNFRDEAAKLLGFKTDDADEVPAQQSDARTPAENTDAAPEKIEEP